MTDDAANPAFSSSIGTEFLISVSLWTSGQRSRCQSYDILQASPGENATQDAQNHTILWGKFKKNDNGAWLLSRPFPEHAILWKIINISGKREWLLPRSCPLWGGTHPRPPYSTPHHPNFASVFAPHAGCHQVIDC